MLAGVRLYREGLEQVLGPRVDIVGTSGELSESAHAIAESGADVVLLDTSVSGGAATVRELLEFAPATRILALGLSDCEDDVIELAEAGVAGYVTREQSLDELVAAIESVAHGEMLCSPHLAATLLRRVAALAGGPGAERRDRLTRRELEIVGLIDDGLSNRAIAQRLSIEIPTVKNHVHNILEKLQVPTRAAAAAEFRRNGRRERAGRGTGSRL